jgi:hypothetical protein
MSSRENPPPSPGSDEEPARDESALAAPASPQSAPAPHPPRPADPTPDLDPTDYYFDGPYLVFTAAYHLKRGACCHSGCRHCPYRDTLED